jgi:hypothetical protein
VIITLAPLNYFSHFNQLDFFNHRKQKSMTGITLPCLLNRVD